MRFIRHGWLRFELVSITSNEPDVAPGAGDFPNDIQGATYGTDDRQFQLRAERVGAANGRVYTVTYRVTDFNGNSTLVSSTVAVAR